MFIVVATPALAVNEPDKLVVIPMFKSKVTSPLAPPPDSPVPAVTPVMSPPPPPPEIDAVVIPVILPFPSTVITGLTVELP